jgi:protein required for attachment to host cells
MMLVKGEMEMCKRGMCKRIVVVVDDVERMLLCWNKAQGGSLATSYNKMLQVDISSQEARGQHFEVGSSASPVRDPSRTLST